MPDVVIYVEDPGAATFAAGLLPPLAEQASVALYSGGRAAAHLDSLEISHRPLPDAVRRSPSQWLADARPARVVSGTAEDRETPGLPLIAAARDAGIPTAGLVDGATNLDHRFRGPTPDPLAFLPDLLLVVDETAREGYRQLGVPAARIEVRGHPWFDVIRRRAANAQKATGAAQPVLLFLAEMTGGVRGHAWGPDYTLHGRGDPSGRGRCEVVLESVLDACRKIEPAPEIVLRLHPKNDPSAFAPYAAEIARISAGGDPFGEIMAADLVVGMTSTLLIEAAVAGRPVLSVLPREAEAAWLPAIGAGVIPAVWTEEALEAALRADLSGKRTPDPATTNRVYPPGADRAAARAILSLRAAAGPDSRANDRGEEADVLAGSA